MDLINWLFLLIGILIILMSLPLIFRKMPFGHWYGIRFSETLSNNTVWDITNKYAGKLLLFLGFGIIFFSLIIKNYVKPDIFSYIMSIYIYFSAIYFYKRIIRFIKKQHRNK
ncbi:MAG TPA: SdpI family protein [Melioribacteraceae bacterium]|nr:SdpI family protein [Melioribacteraceae bacterium]